MLCKYSYINLEAHQLRKLLQKMPSKKGPPGRRGPPPKGKGVGAKPKGKKGFGRARFENSRLADVE